MSFLPIKGYEGLIELNRQAAERARINGDPNR